MQTVDLLIFSGQSNMQGQTEALPEINPEIENALEYRFNQNALIALKHPVGEPVDPQLFFNGAASGHGSLVPDFCREYSAAKNTKVIAVHAAKGATTISEWLHGTQRYHFLKLKVNAAIKKVKESYNIGKIYMLWLQGESDAIIGTNYQEYYQKLIELKNLVKRDLGVDKFAIIGVGYFTDDHSFDQKIMDAQKQAAKDDTDFIYLTDICEKLSLDKNYINPFARGHYSNEAFKIIAKESAKPLAELK